MQTVLVEIDRLAPYSEEGSAGGHELAQGGSELEPGGDTSRLLDQRLMADPGHDARSSGSDDTWRAGLDLDRRPLVRVLAVEQLARVLADELDERRDT